VGEPRSFSRVLAGLRRHLAALIDKL
jgi:hypothetical protein